MGLSGATDSSVYEGLKDVLQRHPVVTTVAYEPDSIVKRFLRAQIDPSRVVPPTSPRITSTGRRMAIREKRTVLSHPLPDPNTGFNCGWHRDDDHPEIESVHFQYDYPALGDSDHERAHLEKTIPTEILWTALFRLFEQRIPVLTGDE